MKELVILSVVLLCCDVSLSCDTEFHGFGVHLGSIDHFNVTNKATINHVIDKIYFDLKIRYFRTSYEPYFSPSPGTYSLSCDQESSPNCTWSWESILEIFSNRQKYGDAQFIASVWSPPFHLMNADRLRLLPEKETEYYFYLKTITQLIKDTYNITIERISPVNEPENVWATWRHCNMDPSQLCRFVTTSNDPLISLCTENSYFWMTKIYLQYKNPRMGIDCLDACKTVASHAYALNINSSSADYGLAYYDLTPYDNPFLHQHHKPPIWMTEVSSTYHDAQENEMDEGLDFATNIINFLGRTCVERYYFWSAFTTVPSGESLIWGNGNSSQEFLFPKKYFIFNHFTNASSHLGPTTKVKSCEETDFVEHPANCLFFYTKATNVTVFTNLGERSILLKSHAHCPCGLSCTTAEKDVAYNSTNYKQLPRKSVCSCFGSCVSKTKRKENAERKSSIRKHPGDVTRWTTQDKVTHLFLRILTLDGMLPPRFFF